MRQQWKGDASSESDFNEAAFRDAPKDPWLANIGIHIVALNSKQHYKSMLERVFTSKQSTVHL